MDDAAVLSTERIAPPGEQDEELALAARTDPAAFGLLYDRHRLAVFRYARTRTASEDDALELTAIAFERALAAMPRYRPTGGGFLAWLLRIARNAAIDAHRRFVTAQLDEEVPDERGANAPEATALMNESRASLLAADVNDRIDAGLLDLFAIQPSAATLVRLDERIARRLWAWDPSRARRSRLRPGRRAGLIGLLAATFALGGATGSLQGLYMFLVGPFDTPWHRGVEVGLSQTVDGYTVTIDRAYADAARLALAISVVDDLRRAGTTQLEAFSAVVTDASGEYLSSGGAISTPDGPFAAVNVAWKQPPELPLPAGPRQLHVVLPFIQVRDDSIPPPDADAVGWNPWHRVAGPWTFDFEIDVDGGTTITPAAVAEIDGVRVSVPRLIAAAGIVRVEMRIDGDLPPGDWTPIGEVRHGDRVLRFVVGDLDAGPDGMIAYMTDGGVDDASGAWTVTVDELVGGEGDARLQGPWVLEFEAP